MINVAIRPAPSIPSTTSPHKPINHFTLQNCSWTMSHIKWGSVSGASPQNNSGCRINFQDQTESRAWYHHRTHLKVKSIDYRKEFSPPFRHEYLVLHLSDGTVCRLERRPDFAHSPVEWIGENGVDALDTVKHVDPQSLTCDIESTSERLATFTLKSELDLYIIFLICYGIQENPITRRYTLQKYNCYFFSWTIILNVARNSMSWEGLLSRSEVFEKEFPNNIVKELSQIIVQGLRNRSTMLCQAVISRVLAQAAILLPLRLAYKIPLLPQDELSDLLRNASKSYHPLTAIRWKMLEANMAVSLERVLTSDALLEKLSRCMSSYINFSGNLGDSLQRAINKILRRSLWRHKMENLMTQVIRDLLLDGDSLTGENCYVPSIDSAMWGQAKKTVVMEIICELRKTILGTFSNLVGSVVASSVGHIKASNPDPKTQTHSRDEVFKVIYETIDAIICDVLQDTIPQEFWKVVGNEKEIDGSIARALGGVIAQILPDAKLPFSLQVTKQWSIEFPLLLKDGVRWHLRRWGRVFTEGTGMQISHSQIEEYFMYRISAHSRSVSRFGQDAKQVQEEIEEAMHAVWKVVASA